MKTMIRSIAFLVLLMANAWAQAPQKFNYQGVARNASGNPLATTTIGLQLSITDGFTTLYSETFAPTTNILGLFNVEVGTGTIISGTFNSIDWLSGAKYLKVEMDPAGGTSYLDMGTSQLLSVPYALVAEKVNSMSIDDLNDVNTTGAVANMVLQWNGLQWVPANVGGGGSDNWGSQTAVTGSDLSGNGTVGSPLKIAQQGAGTGQYLMWNGGAWVPSTISGDNWGTQTVSASSQFTGNGTSGNPLVLAQQGATSGDVLKWSGTNWVPGADNTIALPYYANINSSSTGIYVQNSGTGEGIGGSNTSTNTNAVGVYGSILSLSGGTGSAGVWGENNTSGTNGYGVYGYHAGNGTGVFGQSAGSSGGTGVYGGASGTSGVGVWGGTSGSSGTGVLGLGNVGVKGNSNTAGGYGIWGAALAGGYAGWFDGRTRITSNSNGTDANLMLMETETNDYARLRMSNGAGGQFWEVNAFNTGTASTETFNIWNNITAANIFTVRGDGNVGIGVTNPLQKLDVSGNVKFTGALMPNGTAGTSGQVLISNGAGVAPTWGSSTNTMFNNTYLFDQSSLLTLSTVDQQIYFGGVGDVPFTTTSASKIIFNFSQGNIYNANAGGGNSYVRFKVQLKDNLGTIINQAFVDITVPNNAYGSTSYTHHCYLSTPATYKVSVVAVVLGGDTDVSLYAPGGGVSTGQINLQVIPQ